MSESIELLFLTYGRKSTVINCLESMRPTLNKATWHILDNGSTDGTAQWVLKQTSKKVKTYLACENIGISYGRDIQMRQSKADIIVTLDSDVYALEANWLDFAIDFLRVNKNVGMVGKQGHVLGKVDSNTPPDHFGPVDCLSGFCQVFRRGLCFMDHQFNRHGAEDWDLCLQVQNRGYEVWQIPLNIQHAYAGTWDTGQSGTNVLKLKQKWNLL